MHSAPPQEQRVVRRAAVSAQQEQVRQAAEHAVRMESLPAWQRFKADAAAGLFRLGCPAPAERVRAAKENILRLPMAVDGADFARIPATVREEARWAYTATILNTAFGREKAMAPTSLAGAPKR